MSDIPIYYHLHARGMNASNQTPEAHARAMETVLCAGCLQPRPGVTTIDVWIQGRSPTRKPLDSIWGCGVGLMHTSLLEIIGDDLATRDLYLGKVTNCSGKLVTDWVTFRGRRRIIIRGIKEAGYRSCTLCGRNHYYAAGKRYLYPAPPSDATIYGSDLNGLVVPPEVYERVMTKKWRQLGVDRLPVVDDPPDGLGIIPFRDPKFTDGMSVDFPR